MKNLKLKLSSPVVWATVIPMIAILIAIWNQNDADLFVKIATTLVDILSAFGILNNPNSKTTF